MCTKRRNSLVSPCHLVCVKTRVGLAIFATWNPQNCICFFEVLIVSELNRKFAGSTDVLAAMDDLNSIGLLMVFVSFQYRYTTIIKHISYALLCSKHVAPSILN